jgi:hypothetical protein
MSDPHIDWPSWFIMGVIFAAVVALGVYVATR